MADTWIAKHTPKTSKEVVAHTAQVDRIRKYLTEYKRQKPVLLTGPSGSGKTSIVYALARELDLELIEVNASDVRNKDAILATVGQALKQQSLFLRTKLILVDEVDGVTGTQDRGGIPTLLDLIGNAHYPIIFTAGDAQHEKLKELRKACQVITLDPVPNEATIEHLKRIAHKEGFAVSEEVIKAVARRSGGDLRAAINDLQTVSGMHPPDADALGDREQTSTIEEALLRVFKTTSADIALGAFENVDEELEKLMLWLDENVPREYEKPEDRARAYEALAQADRFFGRIRRWQHWRFLTYCSAFMTVGVALAKGEKYKKMIEYQRSGRPLSIWILNRALAKRKSIAEKIAAATHASTRRVLQDTMPYYRAACRKKAFRDAMAAQFDLDSEEIEWLARA